MAILAMHKLADKEGQERIRVPILQNVVLRNGETVQVATGEYKLVNPDTPGVEHEPWPSAGIDFKGEPPEETTVATGYVDNAVAEGWMSRVNERAVVRPAGPKQNVYNSTHTGAPHVFLHCDEIVFHTVRGDTRYRVIEQPDKYAVVDLDVINEEKGLVREIIDPEKKVTQEIYEAGQTKVQHFYRLERING
jgi:hypothetical protein